MDLPGITDAFDPGDTNLSFVKSSKASSKTTKIVRLVRVVRIAKLFEMCGKQKQAGETVNYAESKVAQHLSDMTTRKVVLMVLVMLLAVPFLHTQSTEEDTTVRYALRELYIRSTDVLGSQVKWENSTSYIKKYFEALSMPVMKLEINGTWPWLDCTYMDCSAYMWSASDYDLYRKSEMQTVNLLVPGGNGETVGATGSWSIRDSTRLSGTYNIVLTIVVIILLTVGAWLFNKTTHELVIHPIERMLYTINQLQEKPLEKPKTMQHDGKEGDSSETGVLERTLAQLTGAPAGRLRRGRLAYDRQVHDHHQRRDEPAGGRDQDAGHFRLLRHPPLHRRHRVPQRGGHDVRERDRRDRARRDQEVRGQPEQERGRRLPACVAAARRHEGRGPRSDHRQRQRQPARYSL